MATLSVLCVVCSGSGSRPTGTGGDSCYHCGGTGYSPVADVDIAALETRVQDVLDNTLKILQHLEKGK
jgi:DnaJ-class molecular chaperone